MFPRLSDRIFTEVISVSAMHVSLVSGSVCILGKVSADFSAEHPHSRSSGKKDGFLHGYRFPFAYMVAKSGQNANAQKLDVQIWREGNKNSHP